MAEQEEQEQPATVRVPVDEPEPLTGRHREFVETDPVAAQYWDSRNWRRA